MMKIVVVGGAGYIGSVLCQRLKKDGHYIKVIDRNIFINNDIVHDEFISQDIRDLQPEDFTGVDIVFDYSGISNDPSGDINSELTYSINLEGRTNVAECAKRAGVPRYVFASSCSVYGSVDSKLGVDETYETNPLTVYAKSALKMEKMLFNLADQNFKVLSIRHGTVYGFSPKMRLDLVVNLMCKSALLTNNIFVTGGGNQRRPLVSLNTIANFAALMANRVENFIPNQYYDVVNLAEDNVTMSSLSNSLKKILDVQLNQNVRISMVPDDNDKRDYAVNTSKLNNFFNYVPQTLNENDVIELIDGLKTIDMTDPRFVTQKWYRYVLAIEGALRISGQLSR
jgi:nucleoside-diphosphate-sugar epimerase